jgi:hypothetical protein
VHSLLYRLGRDELIIDCTVHAYTLKFGFPIRLLFPLISPPSPRLEILLVGKFSSVIANSTMLSTVGHPLLVVPVIATRTIIVVGIIPFKAH